MNKAFFLFSIFALLGLGCTRNFQEEIPMPDPPHNPFDDIEYPNNENPTPPVDSNTFLGLHTYVFSKSCNLPGCHDGTFEPDFRTVQSAYNSLVYHPIVKNYPTGPLAYRVSPGDTSQSMMWHRINRHNPPNFERMPSSGNKLTPQVLQKIGAWIMGGAKDIYGQGPSQTSLQPTCYGVVGVLPNQGDFRVDTARGPVFYNPFMTPADEDLTLWFLYLDVTPAGDSTLGNFLTYNKIKFSTNPVDFSNAIELNMELTLIPDFFDSVFSQPAGFPLPHYQKVTINPAALGFLPGQVVYFRTYVKDSDHSAPTEIPENESQIPLQTYFAFIAL
ncbi:MAG: hypothetical protein IPJ00_06285 [Saprospirales bacterium]|nr:hypothetical protein [Saprospirales bacterium]